MTVLAVDLGGSHVSCALVEDARLIACESFPVARDQSLTAVLPQIEQILERLRTRDDRKEECEAVALSFCGLVDPGRKTVTAANGKYLDSASVDLNAWARARLNLPLFLENDARTALLGERFAGAGRGFDDVVTITLGSGVGGAAMIAGRLIRGKHFQAGCLGGHFVVDYHGRRCTCGNVGCLEAEASTWSLPTMAANHPAFAEITLRQAEDITFATVFPLAQAGDECAMGLRDACLRAWGAGCVSLIHAYDPEVLIIGGGVMAAADQILPEMERYIHAHAWTPWGKVCVRAAELGNHASLFGAIPLCQERLC
jgi:glucokinase